MKKVMWAISHVQKRGNLRKRKREERKRVWKVM